VNGDCKGLEERQHYYKHYQPVKFLPKQHTKSTAIQCFL